MAPRFGSRSIILPGSGEPPAVIMARTRASSSAENRSFGGLPPASIRSNVSPMRCVSVLGNREKTRTFSWTFSDIGSHPSNSKTRGGSGCPIPPLQSIASRACLVEQRARLDLHARSHGGGHRDALDVGALGACGLGLGHRIRQR